MKRLCCAGLLVLLVGCGQAGPERVSVSGTVAYRGTPIDEGEIRLLPTQGTQAPATAAEIHGGKYAIVAKGGVPVGTYKIEVLAYRPVKQRRPGMKLRGGYPEAELHPQEQYLPEKYNEKTTLELTFAPGAGRITKDFNLTD